LADQGDHECIFLVTKFQDDPFRIPPFVGRTIVPLPRFRVRTLMLAVVVVALLLWGVMMGSRSYDYYQRARIYGSHERGWRESARNRFGEVNFAAECAAYYALLAQKYRRATLHPWMPVAPDPHAPGWDQWMEQERRAKEVAPDPDATGVRPPQWE
jgi:hypothetical protein